MGLPEDVYDHPLLTIFCQMHIVDASGSNQFHAGCVAKNLIDDDLFWRVRWEFAVLVALCLLMLELVVVVALSGGG
jgi:hypothetical protein